MPLRLRLRMRRAWRRIRPACIGIASSLVVVDLLGHAYYRLRHGVFLVRDERASGIFRVRPFTVVVPDERVVVPRKSFRYADIRTDENGFRIGSNTYAGKTTNVVFIGDSVPFGWGVDGTQSVPSHFARELERDGHTSIGVINAAVPSYSLYQAVKHYERDVDGRFPVSVVVLQIWDPASQLADQGASWTRDMNFSTQDRHVVWFERPFVEHPDWLRVSSLVYYAFEAHLASRGRRLSPDDAATKAFFASENHRTLQELSDRLDRTRIGLYLLPANPRDGVAERPDPTPVALKWLNESLRSYATSGSRVHFVDVARRFDEVGRDGLFIDDCCHLSDAGAAVQARFLYDEISRYGDLR